MPRWSAKKLLRRLAIDLGGTAGVYSGSCLLRRATCKFPELFEGGFMDKRKAWREQEQLLVERWNAAAERFREAQAALSSQSSGKGELAPDEENVLKAKAARAELETVRE